MSSRPPAILVLVAIVAAPALGQDVVEGPGPRRAAVLHPFHKEAASNPTIPLAEVGHQIDHVGESIRDDGIVVLKQPDVYSQARMTKYRREFEAEMKKDLGSFKTILAGRVFRLDSASVDSQTALGAAVGPAGSTVNVTAPTAANPPVLPALTGATTDPRFLDTPVNLGATDYSLGLEPTVVLDEKQRYLNHLNEIRRVNLGDDNSDSAGYGLYLVRMPVSITPGDKTDRGHGAEISITARHEFPPDFLAKTFRNLVINDLVDLLGPPLYEYLRSKKGIEERIAALEATETDLSARKDAARKVFDGRFAALGEELRKDPAVAGVLGAFQKPGPDALTPPDPRLVDDLIDFVLRTGLPAANLGKREPVLAARYAILADALQAVPVADPLLETGIRGLAGEIRRRAEAKRKGVDLKPPIVPDDRTIVAVAVYLIVEDDLFRHPNASKLDALLAKLAATARDDDKADIDEIRALNADRAKVDADRAAVDRDLSAARKSLRGLAANLRISHLPSNRIAKRTYPIAPREIPDFFLESNLMAIADDLEASKVTDSIRATDVRNSLRQQLSVAFDAMSRPVAKLPPRGAPIPAVVDPTGRPVQPPPLSRLDLMGAILEACHQRAFAAATDGLSMAQIYRDRFLPAIPDNLDGRPIGALCWAIAIDATLLDEALRDQVKTVASARSFPCPDLETIRFYWPTAEAAAAFNDYVARRWPIIAFALDPTTDEQNILDNFSLRRDLQLAVSFAFSTGKINFSQLDSFRRKIEQDNQTIALNRTITSFVRGQDNFGWRITPRFQTPPTQGNFATLTSTLIRGGPGPNYGLRKSKIEPGQRELTAVVVLPSFLPAMRIEAVGNWFRLDDPEHPVVHTRAMLEQGRKVQELRQSLAMAGNAGLYRATDVRFLSAKIDQIEATLPIQSQVIPLPFDSAANGFDLFEQGTSALVPELSGFEGVDAIVGGRECDLLLFGRFISIHETQVVAGGRYLPDDPASVEILSREVVRVRLPGDVLPTRLHDGSLAVEIYLATPNGISNRILVPFLGTPGARGLGAVDTVTPTVVIPVPSAPADPAPVTVNVGQPAPDVPAPRTTRPRTAPSTDARPAAPGEVVPAAYQGRSVDIPEIPRENPASIVAPIVIQPRPAAPVVVPPSGVVGSPSQVTVVPPAPAPKEQKHHSRLRDLGRRLIPGSG